MTEIELGNKNRSTALKTAKKSAGKASKKRQKVIVTAVFGGILALFLILAFFNNGSYEVKFVNKDGLYTDPSTGKGFVAADIISYEYSTEFTEDYLYGYMESDKVYRIPGVSPEEWLVRSVGEDLFELYYEEDQSLPTYSSFEADILYLFVDANIIMDWREIGGEEMERAIDILENGEEVPAPQGEREAYRIRFRSDKYSWFYLCAEYIVTDEGSYFLDLITYTYKDADGIFDAYAEELDSNEG